MCCYLEGVGCEIRLSEPLLKFRSTADLKNTLLHEMIHAFLYVTSNKRDRRYEIVTWVSTCVIILFLSEADVLAPVIMAPVLSYNECDKLQRQDRSSG